MFFNLKNIKPKYFRSLSAVVSVVFDDYKHQKKEMYYNVS